MINSYYSATGTKKYQLSYIIFGTGVGYLCGAVNFFSWYRIPIPPFLNVFISLYVITVAYAIVRYQLLDIRLAITNTGLFLFIYALVLGIPFWMGYRYQMWQHATWIAIVLATVGPFVYFYLQKKAEEHLSHEDLQIQDMLVRASYEMTGIHTLEKLQAFVLELVISSLGLERAEFFLLNKTGMAYAPSSLSGQAPSFSREDPAAGYIRDRMRPILYEEIRSKSEFEKDAVLERVSAAMRERAFQVIVPVHINSMLSGFVGLGARASNEPYSKGMINALSVLSNQAALAIENCKFMEAEAQRMERMGLEERRASLDHVASSMAHEIDNPMMVINCQVESLQMSLSDPRIALPDDLRQEIARSMDFVLEARSRVSGMIRAIQEYSRKSAEGLKLIAIDEVEDGYWKLMGHAFKKEPGVKYTREVAPGLPRILGDKIQLEEVLVNFASNALHAVRFTPEKKVSLKIFQKDADWIRLEYSDSGYGIPEDILKDIFLAHVTTKGSVEGTGLGLYRVRKIVDLHQGRLWAESKGKNAGAVMIVELPIFHGDPAAYEEQQETDAVPKNMF